MPEIPVSDMSSYDLTQTATSGLQYMYSVLN